MVATSLATPPPARSSTTVAHDHHHHHHHHVTNPSSPRPVPQHAPDSKSHSTLPSRRLSLPDMRELRTEWARREALQINALPPGKLQIDLLNVRSDVKVKRPFVRLRMGPQRYFSSCSKASHGDWNEGFLFTISFHNQLFDTIELDLFDRRNGWRSKTRHIGKAKLRLLQLNNRDDVFLTFIPMYEYHTRRYLPAHIQLPHNFLKSHIPRFRTQEQASYREQHPSHRKHSMTPLIGSVQVRVRYSYQKPPDMHDTLSPVYKDADTHSIVSSFMDRSTLASSQSGKSRNSGNSMVTLSSVGTHNTTMSSSGETTTSAGRVHGSSSSSSSSSSRGSNSSDDDQHDNDTTEKSSSEMEDFHDAVEPNLVLVDDPSAIPSSRSLAPPPNKPSIGTIGRQSSIDLVFRKQLYNKLARRTESTRRLDTSSTTTGADGGYGFSRSDMENRRRRSVKRKNSESSIRSHNFGDKNFAFRWINESFEEVALAHPSLDRMIGFVVSPQTRILVRAVVKIFTGFGQGFRITGIQLLSCLSLLQNFYADIPRPPPAEKVSDLRFLDKANYFLGHAIIAYGWRGLSYLGDYAKYLKDVMKTRSNKEAIVRYLKIPQEDLLGYEYGLRKGAVFQPSYFVSIDRGYEAIVLGIRGTWSLYDCITDLVCEYRPWKGGLVHAGMLASAQWFFTRIIPQIFHYIHENCKSETRPISSFIITGHSLGAGTAALITMMVADHIDELRRLSNNPNFQVHCYSYAPVASVSLDLSEKYSEYIDSFVCQDDLVARLSYGTASCSKELIMDTMISVDGLGGSSKINSDTKARKACFDIIETRRQEIFYSNEPRYPLLYIPGQVYQFHRQPTEGSKKRRASTTDDAVPKRSPSSAREESSKASSSRRTFSLLDDMPVCHSEPALSTSKANGNGRPRNNSIDDTNDNTNLFTLHKGSPQLSKEMLISKTCLEDHMLVTYLNAFQAVRQDCMRELRQQQRKQNGTATATAVLASRQSSTSSSCRSESPVPSIQIEDPEGKVEVANTTIAAAAIASPSSSSSSSS
ncbi:hypothetical protein RO3G_11804 [Lichtheimia corymbifera JMRC:FSU:9682]|uniref:sn-1-specific diacylglycerol lipase n=1 Tax=Lichtheimia corymbifera JMRC:FSU:9682 TaxID=1263082 RepID=A0A068S4G8_9FUNG|nr:hypothetical protein RO3G_11804 [Lichtheimia corymbifera JMRC:FSU:9682]